MTLPPAPRVAEPPDIPKPGLLPPGTRRCAGCGGPLSAQGSRAFRLYGHDPLDAVLPLEMYHCPNCGRVEFFSAP